MRCHSKTFSRKLQMHAASPTYHATAHQSPWCLSINTTVTMSITISVISFPRAALCGRRRSVSSTVHTSPVSPLERARAGRESPVSIGPGRRSTVKPARRGCRAARCHPLPSSTDVARTLTMTGLVRYSHALVGHQQAQRWGTAKK